MTVAESCSGERAIPKASNRDRTAANGIIAGLSSILIGDYDSTDEEPDDDLTHRPPAFTSFLA